MTESDLEEIGGERTEIILKTNENKCRVCDLGDVVHVKRDKESILIYTREGTKIGTHEEYRCNNRALPCRAGHFYGYVSLGDQAKCYEVFALKKKFLITSNQTAFEVDYLWDCVLQIVFSNASWESLAKIYNNLHFMNLPSDVMLRRQEIHRKRITEAVMLYAFLDLNSRYGLSPVIQDGLDETIRRRMIDIRDKFREQWTIKHNCDVKGCSSVLTIDGGMKPTRSLCAAKLNGVKEYSQSGMSVVCGCLRNPMPDSKYCGEHVGLATPVINSDAVSNETRKALRDHRVKTATYKDTQQDNLYIVESLLERKGDSWKVKWLGFPVEMSTWEPSGNLQPWITSYYEENLARLSKPLPDPKIKYVKRAGDEKYYYLSWGSETVEGNPWKGANFFSLASEDGEMFPLIDEDMSCNTKKTKDKRERRHTVGILVGTKPCGTVVLFEELYGSESLKQVYGILVEYISRLPEEARDCLKELLYDDACHLKKFADNPTRANLNSYTRYFADLSKHIDNFHFKNHVDPWCHIHCNPKDVRMLDGINTESCEQTFRWVNQFTSVKAMNDVRFWFFFTYVFDLHNTNNQGNLRSTVHPKSPLRWEQLSDLKTWEKSLRSLKVKVIQDHQYLIANNGADDQKKAHEAECVPEVEELEREMDKLTVLSGNKRVPDVEELDREMDKLTVQSGFDCNECGAKYQKPWTLKAHVKKKHGKGGKCVTCGVVYEDSESLKDHECSNEMVCPTCKTDFPNQWNLKRHMKIHDKVEVCKDCKEVFLTKNELSVHIKTHLVCDICQKQFEAKSKLTRHLSTHRSKK